jgi:PhoPQ-activated pathogenicity-related protein
MESSEIKDRTFYHDGVARKNEPTRFANIDNVPNPYHFKATKLVNRLKAAKCEFCGAMDKLAMHHIRKLKLKFSTCLRVPS